MNWTSLSSVPHFSTIHRAISENKKGVERSFKGFKFRELRSNLLWYSSKGIFHSPSKSERMASLSGRVVLSFIRESTRALKLVAGVKNHIEAVARSIDICL